MAAPTLDRELIRRLIGEARSGSDTAFSELAEAMYPWLLEIARNSTNGTVRRRVSGSDIVQLTFMDMWADFREFTGETPEQFVAWATMILSNNVREMIRHCKETQKRSILREVEIRIEELDRWSRLLSGHPSAADLAQEMKERVIQLTAGLPEIERRIVVMRHVDGMRFPEIAERLGRGQNICRAYYSRAIGRLKDRYAKPVKP